MTRIARTIAAIIGLMLAVTLAAPAQATVSSVTGVAKCNTTTSGATITWTVAGTGTTDPVGFPQVNNKPLPITFTEPASAGNAYLTVTQGGVATQGAVVVPECPGPRPAATSVVVKQCAQGRLTKWTVVTSWVADVVNGHPTWTPVSKYVNFTDTGKKCGKAKARAQAKRFGKMHAMKMRNRR